MPRVGIKEGIRISCKVSVESSPYGWIESPGNIDYLKEYAQRLKMQNAKDRKS